MTLCRLFKMVAIRSQIYFRFLVLWRLAFRKAKKVVLFWRWTANFCRNKLL